jgi:hypothetical protein
VASCRPRRPDARPHFLQLDDRALTGLLADIQDAYGELQHRLHTAEARLRACQDRLQTAAPSASPDATAPPEDS